MKYLSEYIQDAQTAAFEEAGAFFAFSTAQFNEAKTEGVKYSSLGGGLICPVGKGQELMDKLDAIVKAGIAQDIEENGKDGIINRELANHECYYTCDITSCVDCLEGYGITAEEIRIVFHREQSRQTVDF